MQISDIRNPWRERYGEASFRGAVFFMDVMSRASGRRSVLHEFPKRDVPYSEDMGRRVRRFHVTAYLIGPDYLTAKETLIRALEQEGAGTLKQPMQEDQQVICPVYSINEAREHGGYCTIEMEFIEQGEAPFVTVDVQTKTVVMSTADESDSTTVNAMDLAIAE